MIHGQPHISSFKAETAFEKLKRHKSPGVDQICSKIHKLINSIWNKEELPKE